MLASELATKLADAVTEHGDYEVLDEAEQPIEDIELNTDEDEEDPVFILTT